MGTGWIYAWKLDRMIGMCQRTSQTSGRERSGERRRSGRFSEGPLRMGLCTYTHATHVPPDRNSPFCVSTSTFSSLSSTPTFIHSHPTHLCCHFTYTITSTPPVHLNGAHQLHHTGGCCWLENAGQREFDLLGPRGRHQRHPTEGPSRHLLPQRYCPHPFHSFLHISVQRLASHRLATLLPHFIHKHQRIPLRCCRRGCYCCSLKSTIATHVTRPI